MARKRPCKRFTPRKEPKGKAEKEKGPKGPFLLTAMPFLARCDSGLDERTLFKLYNFGFAFLYGVPALFYALSQGSSKTERGIYHVGIAPA